MELAVKVIAVVIAFVGLLFGTGLLRDKFKKSAGDLEKYLGSYYGYTFTTKNIEEVVRSVFRISHGKNGELAVSADIAEYNYSGTLKKLGKNLFITLNEVGGEEIIQIVTYAPLASNFDFLLGVFSGVSNNQEPVVGKIVFHKEPDTSALTTVRLEPSEVDEKTISFLERKLPKKNEPNHVLVVKEPHLFNWNEIN